MGSFQSLVFGVSMRSPNLLAGLALAMACLPQAQAQAPSWPSKPVTLLVGVPAGGALDPFARALADQLGKVTGGTFVVENRPGANGNLSAEAALKAPADGHTLWIGTQSTDENASKLLVEGPPQSVQWVEQGTAPERIIGTAANNTPWPGRTRPLCPFPKAAQYSGSGSIDQEASFVCR